MTYQSTCLMAAGQIELADAQMPSTIEPGFVRLKMATASLCGTDLHYYRHFANAGFELDNPVTLGHEACAHVVDANGSALLPDTLVALNPIINCGLCEQCLIGQINLCTAKRFPGSATTKPHMDGFFREYFDFPATCCRPVAADVNPDHLTFAEPLACAMHSVNVGQIKEGSEVLVTGCGPMGLLAIVAAAAKGARVTATDIRAETVDLAKQVGASEGFISGTTEAAERTATFDTVIEASGSAHAFNLALNLVKRQGIVSILSNIQLSDTRIELHRIMLKEVRVLGSFQFNREFEEAVRLIESGTLPLDPLIAAQFPLSQTAEALELMLSGGAAGKILIKSLAANAPCAA
ncbi:zinc-dependent alcohol dehydrogenase [Granulosicoccus antarcticus]|uniref:L-idonate 5-dehydrogenase (NAD(P)(+)) n=1 Tax=Granulosicoccus antarcticus IMCC3135 TaxID=1192854 RepID=A0A2Z2P1A2_9GAMM|nr:alcohol dehydrogenase catalytic domain-containing protein [Granulosicoccus antarcticus]ASJ76281.1 L-idonate 5-dehydrogenase (NAD(P)(+)) [Granulosicoccus antarcticus IMCC3135]